VDCGEAELGLGFCEADCCVCGDGLCQKAVCGEQGVSCPQDCCICGDGYCDLFCGEDDATDVDTWCHVDCCTCGDGICLDAEQCGEKIENCSEDCCKCGDGLCVNIGGCSEILATCPGDCAACGDDICSGSEGYVTCAVDCCGACGDGKCKGGECGEGPDSCPQDCGAGLACGNSICQPGENPTLCPQDCLLKACGNGVCEPGEDATSCVQDCMSSCRDCLCESGESNDTCPVDCGTCGDGVCSSACPDKGESIGTCPQDCCNDDNPCTKDIAVLEGDLYQCYNLPDTLGSCEDALACSVGDSCQAGACVPGEELLLDHTPCAASCPEGAAGACITGVCLCD